MSGKIICPECLGNGYIKKQVDAGRTIEEDCQKCNNQGEIEINGPNLEYLNQIKRKQ